MRNTETFWRDDLTAEFRRLAAEWKRDTADESSVARMAMHPAYQRIIGMGPAALPLILAELEEEYDQWFWALKSITGEDPVLPEDRGYVDRMARSWARWARQNGIVPRSWRGSR
ncbi:hypothetical protein HKM21_28530 [Longimicrobium terrae]|nr:hypothetical protein [Longimicrobium terrae]